MHAMLCALEYHLPENVVSTSDLSLQFPDWSVDKNCRENRDYGSSHRQARRVCIGSSRGGGTKTFFVGRLPSLRTSTMFSLCTQSPDYFLPTTACLVQARLGIPTTAGALDFNLGSSGYIYGLGLSEGLISSGQASAVLLLTAETYSKFMHPRDRSVRTIFGDAAAATLMTATDVRGPCWGLSFTVQMGRAAPV